MFEKMDDETVRFDNEDVKEEAETEESMMKSIEEKIS